jgi:hypothetical protein
VGRARFGPGLIVWTCKKTRKEMGNSSSPIIML